MEYRQELGEETRRREYKVMALSLMKIPQEEAVKMLESGNFGNMNMYMMGMIKMYMNEYIKKYVSAFSHPKSGKSGGRLYIGVDDYGVVQGIPYKGKMDVKKVEEYVRESFYRYTRLYGKFSMKTYNEYFKKMKVEVIKLKVSKKKMEKILKEEKTPYDDYKEKTDRYMGMMREYKRYKGVWEKMNRRYARKLNDMLNIEETKREIIEMIQENSYEKKNYYRRSVYSVCDCHDYYSMMTDMKTGKKYKQMTYEEINKIKDDMSNPFYWTIRWKDGKTGFMKELKPQVPRMVYNVNYAQFMLSQVSRMNPVWMMRNKKMNLYVIRIRMSGNLDKASYLTYKVGNNYVSSYRTIVDGEPCCIPEIVK